MKHVVKEFQHRPGVHCGSTALADVLRYHGLSLSEPMCFGLGCGLDFIYVESDRLSPTRFFNGRTPSLEPTLFQNLGMAVDWNRSAVFPWDSIRAYLERDIPVLVVTDLYYLDYYQTKAHFSLHGVVLVGFDEERGVCFTADTDREGIQETSLDSLAKAMASQEGAVPLENQWLAVEDVPNVDLGQAVRRAVAYNARRMLEPPSDWTGLVALEKFASRLYGWDRLGDWKWAARFGYQVIERRGTGGGAFRKMYAQFLREAETDLDIRELQKLRAAAEMERIAEKWTELAGELKKISEGDRADFSVAAGMAQDLAGRERAFFEMLREATASWIA